MASKKALAIGTGIVAVVTVAVLVSKAKAAPPALVAEADGPYTGTAGSFIGLSGSATGGIPPYSYAWDLDNDGIYETPGQNPSYIWATAGDYTIGLQVTDSAANTAMDTASVHITTAPAGGYVCPFCGATFATQQELNDHINAVHRTPIDIIWE